MNKTLILARHASYRKEGSNNNHEYSAEKHLNFRGVIEAIMLAKYFFELFLYRGLPIVDVIYTSNLERSIQTGKIIMQTLRFLLNREYDKTPKNTIWSEKLKCAIDNMRIEPNYEELFDKGQESVDIIQTAEYATNSKCILAIVHQEMLEDYLDHKYPETTSGAIIMDNPTSITWNVNFRPMFANVLDDEFSGFKMYNVGDVCDGVDKLLKNEKFQQVLDYYAPIHDFETEGDITVYEKQYMSGINCPIPRNSQGIFTRYFMLGNPGAHQGAAKIMELFLENVEKYKVLNESWENARKTFVKEETE